MNIRLSVSAMAIVAASTVLAIELNTPCDLSQHTSLSTYETVSCTADSTDKPYTLSADTTWSTQTLDVPSGSKLFDFTGHTLSVKNFSISSTGSPYITVKGGTMNGISAGNGGRFYLQTDNTASSGRTVVFDGVTVTNYFGLYGLRGRDSVLVVTNGAWVSANQVYLFGNLTDETFTNNIVLVTGGSTFGAAVASDNNFEQAGPGSAALMHNRLVVDGAGSLFIGSKPYNRFSFARYSSGNALEVRNGGRAEWYNLTIGGSENAKHNTMSIAGAGSSAVGGGDVLIGDKAGSDHNRLVISDGADFKAQSYGKVQIGTYGSYNELVVSNAALSRAYFFTAGLNAGASHNSVKFYNGDISLTGHHYFFGAGQYNTFSFEYGSYHMNKDVRAYMSNFDGSKGEASTNNTLRIDNGATLKLYDLKADVSTATNTIFVGEGSTLAVSHDMHIRGDGNRVVVSNGTIRCSQSFPGFCIGSRDETSSTFAEGGSALILQGTHPLIRNYNEGYGCIVYLCDNSTLRFELPEEGYDSPVFMNSSVRISGNGKLEFSGVKKLADNLSSTKEYVLIENGISLVNAEDGASIDAILADANATMPDGSYVYIKSNALILHVKPERGLVMRFR